jgi:hypothetical protein
MGIANPSARSGLGLGAMVGDLGDEQRQRIRQVVTPARDD